MTPHVSTIGERHRKGPITPAQREQIDARFAELQRLRPLFGAYARLRKGGITCAVLHDFGSRRWGLSISRKKAALHVTRSPVLAAKRLVNLAKAHAAQAARRLMKSKTPLPLVSSPLNTIDVEDTTDRRLRLPLDFTQQKCEIPFEKIPETIVGKKRGPKPKVVQEFPKENSRLTNQTRFGRTNKGTTW
jgi:hypothetical protein